MNEYNEGDLVEAVKGETVIRGRVRKVSHLDNLAIENHEWLISDFPDEGFTVSVIEKAAPKLPTEPGLYLDAYDFCWSIEPDGIWQHAGETRTPTQAAHYAPFTRLEPVPVTAKKVAEFAHDWIDNQTDIYTIPEFYAAIEAEFGVTS